MPHDVHMLLKAVMAQIREQKIPLSDQVESRVLINTRARTRLGACRKTEGRYQIQVAAWLLEAPEQLLRETLAHELLHTCPGCMNHGERWKSYAARMNRAYGYAISRVADREMFPEAEPKQPRYLLRCEACGAGISRIRRSKLITHPELYRCRCGGKLIPAEQSPEL